MPNSSRKKLAGIELPALFRTARPPNTPAERSVHPVPRLSLHDTLLARQEHWLSATLSALESAPDQPASADNVGLVVILGCPAQSDGTLSAGLSARVERASQLARLHPSALIVPTGAAVQNGQVEAAVMQEGLIALGVPTSRIVLEPLARLTLENATRTLAMLPRLLPNAEGSMITVTLVTEPFHAVRSLRAFIAAAADMPFIRVTLAAAERLPPLAPPRTQREIRIQHLIADEGCQRLKETLYQKKLVAWGW